MHLCLKISLIFLCPLFIISQTPKELFAQTNNENNIVINEIYYDTQPGESEWIEFYNKKDNTVTLNGWFITDNESTYYFPLKTEILSKDYLVIAKSRLDFEEKYQISPDFEWSGLSLNNSGDELILKNDQDEIIDSVSYEKGSVVGIIPHPGVPKGKSLERQPKGKDTDNCLDDFAESSQTPFIGLPSKVTLQVKSLGNDFVTLSWSRIDDDDFEFYEIFYSQDQTLWESYDLVTDIDETTSNLDGLNQGKTYYFFIAVNNFEGGKSNSNIVSATTEIEYSKDIIITEILPRPSKGADFEFIELYNQSDKVVDISGWMLDDIDGGSSPYIISQGTIIKPREYLVFYKYQTKIALNDKGDMARLFWPNKEKCFESAKYSNASVDMSWAKSGNNWAFTTTITPGSENIITEIDESEDNDIFEGSIEEIKTKPRNSWVKFYGIVTVAPGLFGKRIIYVQDENSGIRIYFHKALWPNLKIGDRVIIIGKISSSSGEFQVRIYDPSAIIILGGSKSPPVKNVKIKDINDDLIGRVIKTSGIVVKTAGSTIWISDGAKQIRIYLYSYTGIKKLGLKKGDKVIISGILSKTSAGFRLLPRTRDEIKIIKYSKKKIAAASLNNMLDSSDFNQVAGADYRKDKIDTIKKFYTLKIIGIISLFSGLLILIILLILVNLVKRNAKDNQIN